MLEIQKRSEAIRASAVESKVILENRCEEETASLFILTYFGSYRGFETQKIVLSDLKKQTLLLMNINKMKIVGIWCNLMVNYPSKVVLKQYHNKYKSK